MGKLMVQTKYLFNCYCYCLLFSFISGGGKQQIQTSTEMVVHITTFPQRSIQILGVSSLHSHIIINLFKLVFSIKYNLCNFLLHDRHTTDTFFYIYCFLL